MQDLSKRVKPQPICRKMLRKLQQNGRHCRLVFKPYPWSSYQSLKTWASTTQHNPKHFWTDGSQRGDQWTTHTYNYQSFQLDSMRPAWMPSLKRQQTSSAWLCSPDREKIGEREGGRIVACGRWTNQDEKLTYRPKKTKTKRRVGGCTKTVWQSSLHTKTTPPPSTPLTLSNFVSPTSSCLLVQCQSNLCNYSAYSLQLQVFFMSFSPLLNVRNLTFLIGFCVAAILNV